MAAEVTLDTNWSLLLRHLTLVEHRLEAASAEVRVLRRKVASLQNANANATLNHGENHVSPSSLVEPTHNSAANLEGTTNPDLPAEPPIALTPSNIEFGVWIGKGRVGGDESPPMPLEWPPPAKVHFDWNEQGIPISPGSLDMADNSDSPGFIDGMASLSVNEGEGYLGVASGAALLRMLQPEGNDQLTSTPRPGARGEYASNILTAQPDVNMHIIDAMIDGYFRTYHLSYPIVHEPRFRAQHSEVIPRPEGNGWKALVYIVAALGAFSSSSEPTSVDGALFNLAKSHLSIDDLETGNMSFVQALALMSNYLQKRNKPNSGYNYLGLSLRMAMGLGFHKEFPKWEISPLELEIRRRVWWMLFVFDVGATITFSRPLGWPTKGIEVALPLNIHDMVCSYISVRSFVMTISHKSSSLMGGHRRVKALSKFRSAKDDRLEHPSGEFFMSNIIIKERVIMATRINRATDRPSILQQQSEHLRIILTKLQHTQPCVYKSLSI
jgi:transcriptional regulatory protein GAL4